MSSLIRRDNLFDDFFKDMRPGFFVRPLHGDPLPSPSQIRIDVKESDGAYTVEAEIPGVKKDEIQVSIDDNLVTVSAEVRQTDSQSDEKSLRSERYYGTVSRSIQLAAGIDESKAKARYDNGVLTLTLPKKQAGSSRQLKVD